MSICDMFLFLCSRMVNVEHGAYLLECCVDVDGKGVQCCMCRKSVGYQRW